MSERERVDQLAEEADVDDGRDTLVVKTDGTTVRGDTVARTFAAQAAADAAQASADAAALAASTASSDAAAATAAAATASAAAAQSSTDAAAAQATADANTAALATKLDLAGGTITGPLVVPTATQDTEAVNKAQLDAATEQVDQDIRDLADEQIANHALVSDGTAHTASGIRVNDGNDLLDSEDVEGSLQGLAEDLAGLAQVGNETVVNSLANVSGPTPLDLAAAPTQLILGSTSSPSFFPINANSQGKTEFRLILEIDHEPAWWGNITWDADSPREDMVWDNTRQILDFTTVNGTDWSVVHVNKSAPIQTHVYTLNANGTDLASAVTVPLRNNDRHDHIIDYVDVWISAAPTTQAVQVDVRVEGTTIFTTPANRPDIATSQTEAKSTTIEAPYWAKGDDLTVVVLQEDNPVDTDAVLRVEVGTRISPSGATVANPTIVPYLSTNEDRSAAILASGETVTQPVAIFCEPNSNRIARIMMYCNPEANDTQLQTWAADTSNPEPNDAGYIRSDSVYPFDLLGGPPSAANLWDHTTDPTGNNRTEFNTSGSHTWKFVVRYSDGSTAVVTNTISTTIASTPDLPATPSNLAAVGSQPDFTGKWDWDANATGVPDVSDAVSYDIRFSTNNPPNGAPFQSVGLVTEYTAVGLTAGTYYAQIRSEDANGNKSPWSAAVSTVVAGTTPTFDAVSSWIHFNPAGDGITPQYNHIRQGMIKGIPLENATNNWPDKEVEYANGGGAWSSPKKVNTNYASTISNSINHPTKTSDVVGNWQLRVVDQGRLRVFQHPSNGGPPPHADINFVITQRRHNSKTWVKNAQTNVWGKTNINNGNKATLGFTPGLPNGTTFAEDSVISFAQVLSGRDDEKWKAAARQLVDNRNGVLAVDGVAGGVPYGTWINRIYMRLGWEIQGPWSSDNISINPNLIGSTVLTNASNGSYGLDLTDQAKAFLADIVLPGDPKIESYDATVLGADINAGYPGYHEIPIGNPNPDVGKGGDVIPLAAAAYKHVFDVVEAEIAVQCAARDVPPQKPVFFPNMAHPGADPDSETDGNPLPEGWAGTGSAPDGGDLYQPLEKARQVDMRYLDLLGREYFAMLNMDFYGRNSLLTDAENQVPHLKDLLEFMVLRYLRPIGASEFGWTARGDKDTATVNTTKLAIFLDEMMNPLTGLWNRLPTAHIVHYLPDGNNEGKDRYRAKKELEDTPPSSTNVRENPWHCLETLFPPEGSPDAVGDLAFWTAP